MGADALAATATCTAFAILCSQQLETLLPATAECPAQTLRLCSGGWGASRWVWGCPHLRRALSPPVSHPARQLPPTGSIRSGPGHPPPCSTPALWGPPPADRAPQLSTQQRPRLTDRHRVSKLCQPGGCEPQGPAWGRQDHEACGELQHRCGAPVY